MSTTFAANRNLIKSKFKDLDIVSHYSIVFSASKEVKTKIFYDFADTIKCREKTSLFCLICL